MCQCRFRSCQNFSSAWIGPIILAKAVGSDRQNRHCRAAMESWSVQRMADTTIMPLHDLALRHRNRTRYLSVYQSISRSIDRSIDLIYLYRTKKAWIAIIPSSPTQLTWLWSVLITSRQLGKKQSFTWQKSCGTRHTELVKKLVLYSSDGMYAEGGMSVV
jgi:hypothetical protein